MNAALAPPQDARAERMSILLQLERRARAQPDLIGLGFLMVNDSFQVLGYRQALLWSSASESIEHCSGLARVVPDAPFMRSMQLWCRTWQSQPWASKIRELGAHDLPTNEAPLWQEYFSHSLVWVPLRDRQGGWLGSLLLSREQPLERHERALLELLQDAYAHAWGALQKPLGALPRWQSIKPRKWVLATTVAAALLAVIPVRQSVLAPAELIARDPAVLRAPLQAVVERILVQPNQPVRAGEPLVQLDRRELDNRLQSARQSLTAADAQLRQVRQQALYDERAKADLAELLARRDQSRSDVDFLEDNLQRSLIVAPRDGVAIFDDPSDWIGRPVSLGERIMQVADPADVRLEILLPVADAIGLETGSEVRLFLNSQPSSPAPATLSRLGYRASARPDGGMAYRLEASIDARDPRLRVGLKGTAKLYGERTLLVNYLLRRPLTAMRTYLGW
ncbi:HlyD family efflux transporter periplasmic adaptor subunit [Pseudomonas sp. LJDD11]|uniref:efflux RND transporter periplasmic adaptor subunit n=1 Tax=Pseudomonas sp. LJDD11 TaxID=2931984 RepID=UPI00211C884F|nr:HlyD family efflux transporter periplasmic adaptor subunit [Pseudomonas sp. LJDD11]MCQ9427209.1 HlyD family efflux transporter periplasmic adaptor subunit [Pseudomonas sp. LJDD11]